MGPLVSCFFFLQSAMVMFDLAWMMSKDLNDMLWWVAPGNVGFSLFLGMCVTLIFYLTVWVSRLHANS